LVLGAACASTQPSPKRPPGTPPAPEEIRSNVLRSDYAGSASCRACHAGLYAGWEQSAMHNMTRLPARAAVQAPFDGSVFRFKGDWARLEQQGAERFMQVGPTRYRVTKVIGGRTREDFAGVDLAGDPKEEVILPVSFLLGSKTFRYKGYSVMVQERPGLRTSAVWNKSCLLCHNTSPYLVTLLGAMAGPAAPAYQGEIVDAALPADRRWSVDVTDEGAMRRAVREEIGDVPDSGSRRAFLHRAIARTRAELGQDRLVEIGIGCEACHGGSRAHVGNPQVLPVFEPRAPRPS
jgi:hypothetical protein